MMSTCSKKKKKLALQVKPSVSLMFLPHLDLLCNLLLNRPKEQRICLFYTITKQNVVNGDIIMHQK